MTESIENELSILNAPERRQSKIGAILVTNKSEIEEYDLKLHDNKTRNSDRESILSKKGAVSISTGSVRE